MRISSGSPLKNAHSCSYTYPSLAMCAKWNASQRRRTEDGGVPLIQILGDASNSGRKYAEIEVNIQTASRTTTERVSKCLVANCILLIKLLEEVVLFVPICNGTNQSVKFTCKTYVIDPLLDAKAYFANL